MLPQGTVAARGLTEGRHGPVFLPIVVVYSSTYYRTQL